MLFDKIEVDIINTFQKNIPLTSRPFLEMANKHNTTEAEILKRLVKLKENKVITRFGPMFNIEKSGGQFMLCALEVQEDEFRYITELLNAIDEVAHNYKRTHERFNMWFVIACTTSHEVQATIDKIASLTKRKVYSFDKEEEYYINLYLPVIEK